MKYKIMAVMASILFLAFNSDEEAGKTMYFNSLKFLSRADGPQRVTMIHSGNRSGQSTLDLYGTLFTYRNRGARSVQISGSFSRWKPERMKRSDNGVWYYFLPAREGGREITYKFIVDGILTGASLKTVTEQVWIELLNRAAIGSDARAKAEALILLADHSADASGSEAYGQYRAALRESEGTADLITPGVLESLDARRAMACGRSGEALRLGEKAAVLLKGGGLVWEALNLQLVAILQPEQETDAAVATLQSAIDVAKDPELSAQIRHNFALFCGRMGRLDDAAECSDIGIRTLEETISPSRLIKLRIQRAWSWAHLGRIDHAMEEAASMLRIPSTWFALPQLLPLRLLLGYCHLHRGFRREAISEVDQAWRACGAGVRADLHADCLRAFIDTLIDLHEQDIVSDRSAELRCPMSGSSGSIITTNARRQAALAEAIGNIDGAAAELEGQLDAARHLRHHLATARYLHHLGLVRMAQYQIGVEREFAVQAVRLFQEETDILGTSGFVYYRARALLNLATALRCSGQTRDAEKVRARATGLARASKCRGLLAECLQP